MTPILCFDIETIPDVAGLRRLRPEWAALEDGEVAELAFAERRDRIGSDFLQHHLHRIVAIGCAFRDDSGFRVRCLGEQADPESRLIQDFFRVIERYTPQATGISARKIATSASTTTSIVITPVIWT